MTLPDIWRQVSARIGFFTKETRSQIPEVPGCYAWFIPLWIYRNDLRELVELINGLLLYDPATGGVSEHIARFNWDSLAVRLEKVTKANVTLAKEADWNRIFADPRLKEAFQQALMEASILMPPLYVGKTDNLQARYTQHVLGSGSQANVFHTRFTEFASAAKVPLAVSDLLFVCIQTDRDTDTVLRNAGLNELLEHVLMCLCKPPFSLR